MPSDKWAQYVQPAKTEDRWAQYAATEAPPTDPKAEFQSKLQTMRSNMAAQAPALDKFQDTNGDAGIVDTALGAGKALVGDLWNSVKGIGKQVIGDVSLGNPSIKKALFPPVKDLFDVSRTPAAKMMHSYMDSVQEANDSSNDAFAKGQTSKGIIEKGAALTPLVGPFVHGVYDAGASDKPGEGIGMAGSRILQLLALKPGASDAVKSTAADVLGSKTRGAAKLAQVEKAAADLPIGDTSKLEAIAQRSQQLAAAGGGQPPMPIKMFLRRMGQVEEKGPITYKEGRDFAMNSNFKAMAIEDAKGVSSMQKAQLDLFKQGWHEANATPAMKAGLLDEYLSGLKDYRVASKNIRTAKTAVSIAAPVVGAGAAARYIGSIADMLRKR